MKIEGVQFLMPHGRKIHFEATVPDKCEEKWKEARAHGLILTVEVLTTGEVSGCLEYPSLGDFDIFVCPNGPEVIDQLTSMITRFDAEALEDWKRERLTSEEGEDDAEA